MRGIIAKLRAVPDTPSAEPIGDLAAQFADAADPKTQRSGVLIPHGNMANPGVQRTVHAAQVDGRAVQTPNGDVLVLQSRSDAGKVKRAFEQGQDPQAVIGRVTGAGNGKRPDQVLVVQGRTPAGDVATEGMVAPHEVAARVEQVKAEGKHPAIMTIEMALARRLRSLSDPS